MAHRPSFVSLRACPSPVLLNVKNDAVKRFKSGQLVVQTSPPDGIEGDSDGDERRQAGHSSDDDGVIGSNPEAVAMARGGYRAVASFACPNALANLAQALWPRLGVVGRCLQQSATGDPLIHVHGQGEAVLSDAAGSP